MVKELYADVLLTGFTNATHEEVWLVNDKMEDLIEVTVEMTWWVLDDTGLSPASTKKIELNMTRASSKQIWSSKPRCETNSSCFLRVTLLPSIFAVFNHRGESNALAQTHLFPEGFWFGNHFGLKSEQSVSPSDECVKEEIPYMQTCFKITNGA